MIRLRSWILGELFVWLRSPHPGVGAHFSTDPRIVVLAEPAEIVAAPGMEGWRSFAQESCHEPDP